MSTTSVTLVDASRGLSSTVMPRAGVAWQGLDVAGAVRAVTDPRPGGDGVVDNTLYADAAAVSLTVRVAWPARALLDEYGAFMVPSSRPYLVVTDDEWTGARQLRLRAVTASKPIVIQTGSDRTVLYQWVAPDGVWTDTVPTEYDINASAASTEGLHFVATTGLDFAPTVGITLKPTTTTGDSIVSVAAGSIDLPWQARLYGPCVGPKLANDTTGGQVAFTDSLVLAAGEYVLVDSLSRTANKLSDPAQPQLSNLDFANTTWWRLRAGTNLVRYNPSSTTGPAVAVLTFQNARMP